MARIRTLATLAALGAAVGAFSEKVGTSHVFETDSRERGRRAQTPSDMTWLGWKDILIRTYHETFDDRLFSVAASVAFYGLLALVPSLSVLISLYGIIADPSQIYAHFAPLFNFMPDSVVGLITEQAQRIASESNRTLSFALLLNLLIATWSANAAIKALFDALNIIYEEEEKRSFVKLSLISLLTTLSAAIVVVLAIVLTTAVPTLLAMAPFSLGVEKLLNVLRWPVFFVLATIAIATLYWIGPSRQRARFVWVLPGAAFAALLWAGVSALFSFYVSTLGNYQVTYGSLAAVVVFMTWLWLSASVILLGAELNSELEHQTERDTTEGMPKPRGVRGAVMADTVGPRAARS